jgi:hypothetical protein
MSGLHNVKLAGKIKVEELEMQTEKESCQEERKGVDSDNNEGWINEHDNITEKELNNLDENVQPIQFVLTKVSKHKVLYSIS